MEASQDAVTWTSVQSGVMPSARAVQFVDFPAVNARYLRLNVTSTWSAANAPNYYKKLRIDEVWTGGEYARSANTEGVSYEAEAGLLPDGAKRVRCDNCSGGLKVQFPGRVLLPVVAPLGGERVITVVGTAEGTKSFDVNVVNSRTTERIMLTGWSSSAPLIGRAVTAKLNPGLNLVSITGTADLDRIVIN
ncbi:hypothetical protein JOF56_000324 [Kibdelosporangium banguiense]|uniref:F5/8 type C domain-containing protein n=1 Tax=Kibdelosporangium banguiense TaxID=1365924 RepID=A0ABS4T648_9PSEU|nr:hypothetical protein [Kibdelosporangium banguiense]MBP2319939.1 hypothetical protein [Kibdelosporangium banguiense]